jgi:spermidine/putrescine transport system permease protein
MNNVKNLMHNPGNTVVAWGALLFLYLPIVTLVALSFNQNDLTTVWGGLSPKWYETVLNNSDILRAAKNSLIVATLATLVSTTIATATALGLARSSEFHRRSVETMLGLPLLVPEIVTAVALLMLFVIVGIPLGLLSVILAHTVFCIPFAYYPIRSRLAGLDAAMMDAASDLYASAWRRFTRIELPLLAPGVFAGALLAFISSLGDFVITYFVSGPGSTTLPVYIYGMIRTGVTPEVNALSVIFLVASVVFIAFAFAINNHIKEKRGS